MVDHHHDFLALNPNAPEFHPYYHFTPLNYNTSFITNNIHIIPNTNNHYYHIYYPLYFPTPPPPPPLPPPQTPQVQLPHHHFHHQDANFQEYTSPYFTPFDHQHVLQAPINTITTYYINNDQTTLRYPNDFTMQPQPQPQQQQQQQQLVRPSRVRGPGSTRARSRRFYPRQRAGPTLKSANISENGSGGNNVKKEWLISKNEDEDRVRVRGKCGKMEIMKVKANGLQTTAMIRNVPNQYTRTMLMKFLDDFCNKENEKVEEASNNHPAPLAYDFVYLPIDFKRGANKGYAFVNFTHPIAVWKLHLACSDRGWDYCKSPKICQIAYASIQGKERLIEHFGCSRFNCNQEEYLPICFNPPRDGSGMPVKRIIIGERITLPSYLQG